MNDIIKSLKSCSLFTGFSDYDILKSLDNTPYQICSYNKNQLIANEGETCMCMGIIIQGSIEIKKIFASGRIITVTTMSMGDLFGEVLMFVQSNKYPSTIISYQEAKVLYLPKKSVMELCRQNIQFTNNLMTLLAGKVLTLNNRVKYLSYQTIRQKLSNLILDEYQNQKSLTLNISLSRKEMAELLGVARPSLSREMINMREEQIIDFHKSTIKINNLSIIEDIALG